MKHVDHIIKYLSGDLDSADKASFDRRLKEDAEFLEEYTQLNSAWPLVQAQLQHRDNLEFKTTLIKAMEEADAQLLEKGKSGTPAMKSHRRLYFLVPLAASLAILLAIYVLHNLPGPLFSRFFQPEKDPVLLALHQDTRGEMASGIKLYKEGSYQTTIDVMYPLLEQDSANHLALLYLVVSFLELDQAEEVESLMANVNLNMDSQIGQSICWYSALSLLRLDQPEKAAIQLQPLILGKGPYERKALQLEKNLLK